MVKKLRILSDWNNGLAAYTIPSENLQNLKSQNDIEIRFISEADHDYIQDCDAYFGNIPTLKVLDKMHNLKWVHFGSAGIDKLSKKYIKERKLTITNIGDTNAYALATFCFGEIFSSCKINHVSLKRRLSIDLSREEYNQKFDDFLDFNMINLCILGYGKTSEIICNNLSNIVNSISVLTNRELKDNQKIRFFSRNELLNCLSNATHIINLLSLNEQNHGFVNKIFFDKLKSKPYLINVGRSETTSVKDIKNAFKDGKISGATIDVHGLPGGKIAPDLLEEEFFSLTPHIAGWTNTFWKRNYEILNHNIKIFLNENILEMHNLIYENGNEVCN
tara:strand:+ start:245 stop:1243 length:999 start_codon:yes stop_codon:yes gene_type:complete